MAMGDVIARLSVVLGMETAAFEEGATIAEKRLNQTSKRIAAFGDRMTGLGQKLAIGLTAPLAALGVKAVQGFVDQERAVADVESALRSMGGQSGKTAAELAKTADAMEMRSLFDADVILKQVTANLLTFGNVAGKEFDRAQQAAVDMATRLGGEPQAAAIMLGKALNDPVKGIAALTKVGIQFTEGQKAQIKEMTKLGNVAGAQGVILAEVERQFAGAAQAAADATPWRKAQVAIGQAMDAIGQAILPLIGPITDAIVRVAQAFAALPEPIQKVAVVAGVLAAALGPVLIVFGSIVSATAPLIAGLKFVAAAAVSTGTVAGGLTVALTGLRAMVVSLVASLGPFALAAAAVGGAIAYFISQAREGSTASKFYADALDDAKKSSEAAQTASQNLAFAHGAARDAALKAAKAERELIKQKVESARRSVILAKAELARARAFQSAQNTASIGGGVPGTAGFIQGTGDRKVAKAQVNLETAAKSFSEQMKALADITKAIEAPAPVVNTPTVDTSSAAGSGARSGGSAGRTGPTRAEIEARFADAQNQLEVEALQAKERLATNIEDRADIQYDLLDKERESRLAAIAADEDYTAEQKAALTRQVEALYGVAAQVDAQGNIIATANRGLIAQQIERDKLMEMERDAMETARDEFDIARDQLAVAADLADTQADRKRIVLEILELEQQYRRNQLEMVAASATASDAEKERARRILASLDMQDALDRQAVSRANETDVEKWIREANKNPAQFAEARSGIALDGLDGLIDGLSQIPGKVDSIKDAFSQMRNVFHQVIQSMLADLIRLQLQKAISGMISGILGGIGGSVGGSVGAVGNGSNMSGGILNLPGFATGTNFAPGGLALVGERGPELVNLPRGSRVTPNNELRGMGGDSYAFDISVSGPMSADDARRTGNQIGAAASRRLAMARRSGMAG